MGMGVRVELWKRSAGSERIKDGRGLGDAGRRKSWKINQVPAARRGREEGRLTVKCWTGKFGGVREGSVIRIWKRRKGARCRSILRRA